MDFASCSLHLMGSSICISLCHERAEILLDEAVQLLHLYKNRFSANDEDSELMSINHLAGIESISVHPELFELIELGKYHSQAEGSHLNITIGPLVQTWRIGFSDARLPSREEIQQALSLTDPNLLELNPEDCSVFLTKKGMKLDLGALAKGYIADKIKDYLLSQGVTSALINLGGNVLTIGHNAVSQRAWRIGIQNPKQPRGNHSAILAVTNQSVVTSGIYERTLTVEGQNYHHILDRKTGYPIENQLASLTIVSDKSVDGEIWTTRLFGESPTSILSQIEQQTGIEALIITQDDQIFCSSGLLEQIIPAS
ncbi:MULTISPECIES: FAD:protein FMN transferase [Streptococcus]|uniref:FAD:protein FMN transferase n=1 Tax=Streptococcus sanguinis TaxID=1305 RepID=A0A5A7ZUM2_STRSA|nr:MULTISPECIES: FAD:protein FMN transferase [Streptococcus]KAA0119644.1 FAD:protein FMN transferase [Streptococcus sanguinis]WNU95955.1 FAD:protein FMN transferase [Streptococcus sp. DTU_2020_1000888_1_SI_GRL_NUU_041A]